MLLSSLSLLASSLVPLAALPGSFASPVTLTIRNNAGRPTAQLQNGTVRGVHLPTFAQDGAFTLRNAESLLLTFAEPMQPSSVSHTPSRPSATCACAVLGRLKRASTAGPSKQSSTRPL